MTAPIIRTDGLSKLFWVGGQQPARRRRRRHNNGPSLRQLLPMLRYGRLAEGPDTFWALKDIDLEVKPGEVLGIVGRNGSGKSTLLKILARITDPTEGSIAVGGRVGSLLEVGTGFHPELTGRQNIFLNGTILGMRQAEIGRRFDEIVEFAEVAKFIDTPVKHYSSGMYTRLAFAVAAHLECEIMLVDEVLAVGDIHFQRRCLGKISDEIGSGRTVLFVSHNASMVLQICTRCIWLDGGRIVAEGPPHAVIESYANEGIDISGERKWSVSAAPAFPDGSVRLRGIRALDRTGAVRSAFDVKDAFSIEVAFDVVEPRHALSIHLYFRHEVAGKLFVSMDNLDSPWGRQRVPWGSYRARCEMPADFLNEGMLTIDYVICTNPTSTENVVFNDALVLTIGDDMRNEGVRGDWVREWPASMIRPRLKWHHSIAAEQDDAA
jgi:lipopolysaccharide transport system ATP-binding protein